MRDSVDPTAHERGLAKMLLNVYPVDPQHGGAIVHRINTSRIDQGDLTSQNAVQTLYQFTKLDGTERTIAVHNAQIYRYNWLDEAWTQLATFLASFPSSSRIFAVTFADQVIFSSHGGTAKPMAWDGTVAGGTTSLSATSGPFYGPPVVHYGKLFGIKADERSTIVWSEENAPNLGYESGGYNNAWTLGQTDTNRLVRLLGTNDALLVFRERSITAIYGEVNENFASTGTQDGVSTKIGTASPTSVFFGGDGATVFFADADGRPHYLTPGGRPIPIWEDARETLRKRTDRTRYDTIEGYWDPVLEHAVFCYAAPGETKRSLQLRYHMKLGAPQLCAVWDGFDIHHVATVENADGEPVVLHAAETQLGGSFWLVYEHHRPSATFSGTDERKVELHPQPYSENVEWSWSRADLTVRSRREVAGLELQSVTRSGIGTAVAVDFQEGISLWDEALWDEAVWDFGEGVSHGVAGLDAQGLMLGLIVKQDDADAAFSLLTVSALGVPVSGDVGVR